MSSFEGKWTVAEREFYAAFGEQVRTARVQRGLSQSDLAAVLDYHRTSIGGIENGRQAPSAFQFITIMDVLDIEHPPMVPGKRITRPTSARLAEESAVACCEDEATGIEGEHSPDCPRPR